MSTYTCLKLFCSLLALSATALQLSADLAETGHRLWQSIEEDPAPEEPVVHVPPSAESAVQDPTSAESAVQDPPSDASVVQDQPSSEAAVQGAASEQLVAHDPSLDRNRTAPDTAETWISEAEAIGKFGERLVPRMVEIGAIMNRSNPDEPSRTQYAMNWMSEKDAFRHFHGRKSVMKLVQEGKLQKRQNPEAPASAQYMVSTSYAASMAPSRHGSAHGGRSAHAQAKEKHVRRNKTAVAAKALRKTKHAGTPRKSHESHEKTSERREKKLSKNTGDRAQRKLEHRSAHGHKAEPSTQKRAGEKTKAQRRSSSHQSGAEPDELQHQETLGDAEGTERSTLDRMGHAVSQAAAGVKGAASSMVSKISSIFKDNSQTTARGAEDEEDGELHLFRQPESKPVKKTAKAMAPSSEADSKDGVHLPDVDVFMSKPSNVFQSLSAKIDALKASLADKHAASHAAVAALKAKYEANLSAIRRNISGIDGQNRRLKKAVSSLNNDNEGLRAQAKHLTKNAGRLRRQLGALQENITTVQEFIQVSMEVPADEENNTLVLRELDQQDRSRDQDRAHESALARVRGTSLLQVGGENDAEEDDDADSTLHSQTLNYLTQLGTNLEDLDAEEASSEESLKQHFEEDYAVEVERQREALDTQADLIAQKEDAERLQTRLQAAVTHLDGVVSRLDSRLDSLKAFVIKLGHA